MKRPPAGTPRLYAQDGRGLAAIVHAHYFVGACDWLVTEFDPADDIAFGWACLGDRQNAELGYVSLAELEAVEVGLTVVLDDGARETFPIEVEFDENWEPISLADAIARLDRMQGRTA